MSDPQSRYTVFLSHNSCDKDFVALLAYKLKAAGLFPSGFDNMGNRAVKGTSEWKKYEITLDVPENAVNIGFGAFVAGKGQAWVDDFLFEVVGKDVASTNMLTPEQQKEEQGMGQPREYPRQAINLDFEG